MDLVFTIVMIIIFIFNIYQIITSVNRVRDKEAIKIYNIKVEKKLLWRFFVSVILCLVFWFGVLFLYYNKIYTTLNTKYISDYKDLFNINKINSLLELFEKNKEYGNFHILEKYRNEFLLIFFTAITNILKGINNFYIKYNDDFIYNGGILIDSVPIDWTEIKKYSFKVEDKIRNIYGLKILYKSKINLFRSQEEKYIKVNYENKRLIDKYLNKRNIKGDNKNVERCI